jgi:predicted site-specific integrase-resolvase
LSFLGVETTYEDFNSLLTPELAADRVGVSKQLLNYWRATGKLPVAERRNGQPLYRLGDVLAAESVARSVPRRRRARIIAA